MADRYTCFAELAAHEREAIDYRIHLRDRGARVVVVAPHGGFIEPGTSVIARAIAADDFSLYLFEGLIDGRLHSELHIGSERFDEPGAVALIARCAFVVTVHGRKGDGDAEGVWLGGLDEAAKTACHAALQQAGFQSLRDGHRLPGNHPDNLCNRTGAGLQLEVPRLLRDRFGEDGDLLTAFSDAVRAGVLSRLDAT